MSAITFYEVISGIRKNGTVRQLAHIVGLADGCEVVHIAMPVLERAASFWARVDVGGHPRDDVD